MPRTRTFRGAGPGQIADLRQLVTNREMDAATRDLILAAATAHEAGTEILTATEAAEVITELSVLPAARNKGAYRDPCPDCPAGPGGDCVSVDRNTRVTLNRAQVQVGGRW